MYLEQFLSFEFFCVDESIFDFWKLKIPRISLIHRTSSIHRISLSHRTSSVHRISAKKVFSEIEQRDVIVESVVYEIIDESLNLIVERHTDQIAIDTAVNDVMSILSDAIRRWFFVFLYVKLVFKWWIFVISDFFKKQVIDS